ncbi:hypothetical protein F4780DRAFT_685519 [Xylariomycetidae sp. FL0641]|nr:hypothetical protein F4780DRAFT_685519 [Xylariomycetidae sp. FL0641]
MYINQHSDTELGSLPGAWLANTLQLPTRLSPPELFLAIMKVHIGPVILLGLGFYAGHTVADIGWFEATCADSRIVPGTTLLESQCELDSVIPPKCSRLDLNHCLGIAPQGWLTHEADGNFGNWCSDCYMNGTAVLECTCTPPQGGDPTRQGVALEINIFNDGGFLCCFHAIGDRCEA